MYPGMPNMPPNMILGPSGMPYYPGQGGQMPYRAATSAVTGRWAEDEDDKLKDAVETHGGKNWAAIAALIPGRTRKQCRNRWHSALDPSISLAAGRGGKWTAVEDSKLKDAVQTHGGMN
jgi:hypothetical protein